VLRWRRKLARNAKWLLATEPGWSVPMPWVFYYQPLYMVALGASEVELGAYMSVSRAVSVAAPFLAVHLAARLGFKKAFLVLDTAANVGYLLLLLTGRRELFGLALALSALYAASGPLWEVLLVEGSDPEAFVALYSIPSVIYTVGSSATPLAGLLLERFGVVEGFRVVAAIALASFAAKTAVLAATLVEPRSSPADGRRGLKPALRLAASDRRLLAFLVYSVIASVLFTVPSYLSLYLCDARGARLSVEAAGLVPTVSSAVSLAVLALVTLKPPVNRTPYLALSAALGVASSLLYALSPAEPRLAFLAAALSGLRGAEFSVSRAFFMDMLEGFDAAARSQALSLLYTASSVFTIPAPTAVGYLYSVHPTLIWALAASASASQLAIVLWLSRAARTRAS
jgi:MFS family permease